MSYGLALDGDKVSKRECSGKCANVMQIIFVICRSWLGEISKPNS
jgi:hypothetical protein